MPPNTGDKVPYYRVSVESQGKSGLGLEAQRKVVHDFLDGGDWKIIEEFEEIESGRVSDRHRPQLRAALQLCRDKGATLVVARLDRLTRNVHFLSQLLDSGVPFVACDVPNLGNAATNRFILQIMAGMAEFEAARISANTKAALAVAKSRGRTLGNPRAAETGKNKEAKIQAKKVADDFAKHAGPIIDELEQYGCSTLAKIAVGLEARGVKTMRGKTKWSLSSVRNVRIRWVRLLEHERGLHIIENLSDAA